ELPCGVAVEPVGDTVGMLLVVEADRRVSAVAPRLRFGPSAPAQGSNRRCRRGLAEEVRHRRAARPQVGTVFPNANATVWIARDAPSDFSGPGDLSLSVLLADGHEVVGACARLEHRGPIVACTRAGEIHR